MNPGTLAASSAAFHDYLAQCTALAQAAQPLQVRGRLTRVAGLVMEAVGLRLPVGSQVVITQDESLRIEAEVVGFAQERLFLMPTSDTYGLRPGAMVVAQETRRARRDCTRAIILGGALKIAPDTCPWAMRFWVASLMPTASPWTSSGPSAALT